VTTLRAALVSRLGERRVLYSKGAGITDGSDADIAAAVAVARRADVVLLALGESAGMSGEANSRAHLTLPGQQQLLLEKIVATGKPVVLILFSGRPLTVPFAFEHVQAVLAAWFPGVQAGPALTRVLWGESSPSGRLVVSWPRSVGQEPLYYNVLNTGRPLHSTGGNEFGSRYIDEQNSPQFPFGFGLSYTTVQYGATRLSAERLTPSGVEATAVVTNTGTIATDEVVQLYVRIEGTSTAQPVRALKAFQRIKLTPGESREVKFALPAETFAIWSIDTRYVVEPAHATVWISPDATTGVGAGLEIQP
jgi:beta-glucosidase